MLSNNWAVIRLHFSCDAKLVIPYFLDDPFDE